MTARRKLTDLFQPHLQDMKAYVAPDPPEVLAARLGIPASEIIKLDGNENPYGSSPKVALALQDHPWYHVYPDAAQRGVRQALSEYVGIDPDCLIAGFGSDELIDLLARLFLGIGDETIDLPPTFGMYPIVVETQGGRVISVPRTEDFQVDVEQVLSAVTKNTKLVFLANPNNPTGNMSSEETIRQMLGLDLIVVVDETYYEFCGKTVAHLVDEYENLVVLRTLSKWAGLAGLRLGYGIMNPVIVERLMTIKPPFNLTVATEVALVATLADRQLLMERVHLLVQERERMASLITTKVPGVHCFPSEGNFLLCKFPHGIAAKVQSALAQRGVFVRHFSDPRISDCLRISVGKPDQTDTLIKNLVKIIEELL
jgi:histidinol-phosphate aminotransferase